MKSRHGVVLLVMCLIITSLPVAPTQAQERLQLVASFSILADVVANVAGETASVTTLIPNGADPHSFTPSPRDLVALAEADAVFTVGANYEQNLNDTIANAGQDVKMVVVSNCVDILPLDSDQHDHESEADHEAEAGDLEILCQSHRAELDTLFAVHDHPDEETTHDTGDSLGMLYTLNCDEPNGAGSDHEHSACDPHVWTDPYNVMQWVLVIRDTLSSIDPANAGQYTANAAAYLNALQEMTAEIEAQVATIPQAYRKMVTNHLVYGYFARSFGFEVVGTVIPGVSTLAEPSARQVAELIDTIRAENVTAIFADTTANPALAEQIAGETGAQFFQLYTGSLTAPDGAAPTYIDYMLANTRIIVEALSVR